MASPGGGYNPAVSMLPVGGGTIHAMSGGYNPMESMIPSVPAATTPITACRGGAVADESFNRVLAQQKTNTATLTAAKAAATAAATAAIITAVTPASAANPIIIPAESPSNSLVPTIAAAAATTTVTPAKKTAASSNTVPTKSILLFQQLLTLRNPRTLDESFEPTEDEQEALTLFGVENIKSAKHRLEILQGIYDGDCSDNTTLSVDGTCEPIRRIVRTLMEKYLDGLVVAKKKNGSTNKKAEGEKKTAEEEEKTEEGEKMKVKQREN